MYQSIEVPRMPSCLLGVLISVLLGGCGGPEYATVSGKVTLDGQPLGEALVSFVPAAEDAVPAFARTDSQGMYQLREDARTPGAMLGNYKVRVTTFVQGTPDGDSPTQSTPEKVPTKYNLATQLSCDVASGENVYNIELDSQGEIFQPDSLAK